MNTFPTLPLQEHASPATNLVKLVRLALNAYRAVVIYSSMILQKLAFRLALMDNTAILLITSAHLATHLVQHALGEAP